MGITNSHIHSRSATRRWLTGTALVSVIGGGAAFAAPSAPESTATPLAAPSGNASASTFVSLTFDDGSLNQYQARQIFADRGMHATFYVNSGRVGTAGYMTQANLLALQADGNEIAGHTVSHPNLTQIDPLEQRRQICNDRVALLNQGFAVTSFAFPFGAATLETEQIVLDCNYTTSRGVGGIVSPAGCFGCPRAESIPPIKPMHMRTPNSIKTDTTLADIQYFVTQAEQHGGGWVQYVIHDVCDGCSQQAISPALLATFLDWLAPRASLGTVVKTIQEVTGAALLPAVAGPPPPPPPGVSPLQNESLELDSDHDTIPDCWQRAAVGQNTANWYRTTDSHSGGYGQRVEVTSLASGDRKLISRQDLGTCSPPVTAGQTYAVTSWYKTDTSARFVAYYRTTSGGWLWYAQSPILSLASSWKKGSWVTPPMPSDADAISVGLSVRAVGSLTVDDFTLAATPP